MSLENLKNVIRGDRFWASVNMKRKENAVMAIDQYFLENCPSYNTCPLRLTRECPLLELWNLFPDTVSIADIYDYMKFVRRIDLAEAEDFENTDEWFENAFSTIYSNYTIPIWKICDLSIDTWLDRLLNECDCIDEINKLMDNLDVSMMESSFFEERVNELKAKKRRENQLKVIPEICKLYNLDLDIGAKIAKYTRRMSDKEAGNLMRFTDTSRAKKPTDTSRAKKPTGGKKNKKKKHTKKKCSGKITYLPLTRVNRSNSGGKKTRHRRR